jgi:hypothetical protein
LRKELSVAGLFGAVILLGLSAYTYTAYLLFAPLTYGMLVFLHINKDKKRFIQLTLATMLCIILFTPFILQKAGASVRASQVGILSNINSVGIMNEINEKRGECLDVYPPALCRVLYNAPTAFASEFIKHYLLHFSPELLYTKGTITQFSILPQRGLDFLFGSVFLICGILFLTKHRINRTDIALCALFLMSPIPDSLTGSGNFSRAAMMQPFIALLTGYGIASLTTNFPFRRFRIAVAAMIISGYILAGFWFFVTYTSYYKDFYSQYSQYGYRDLMTQIQARKDRYDTIYITRNFNDTKQYIYYLLYTRYDPLAYQSRADVDISEENGWISVDRIGSVYFTATLPDLGQVPTEKARRILLVSHPVDFRKDIATDFVIKDRLGNVLFKAVPVSELYAKK